MGFLYMASENPQLDREKLPGIPAEVGDQLPDFGAGGVEARIKSRVMEEPPHGPIAALDSPTSGYSYDGEREGIAQAP